MSTFLRAALTGLACSLALPLAAAPEGAPPAAEPGSSDGALIAAAAPKKSSPAEAKFWKALLLLAKPGSADIASGRDLLVDSSDLEFTHAQILLGNCYLTGAYGFAKDARKGAALFRLAAERGNAFAKVSLGQCYFNGTGLAKDQAKAFEWLTGAVAPNADYSRPVPPPEFLAARSAGNSASQESVAGELERDPASESRAAAEFLLGQILMQEKKPGEAQAHFLASALAGPNGREGNFEAARQAALNYAFGNGVPRDLAKANEMLDQSRKLGARAGVNQIHNNAMLKLVDNFATGDLEDSVSKAGDAYESELQFKIASTFADKKSKDYNPAEAVKWYELAAEGDKPWAMLSLAFMYVRGDLGKPDFGKAVYWFDKAGGGDPPKHTLAAANLGIAYENGLGVAVDHARAAEIFGHAHEIEFVCYLGSVGKAPHTFVTYEQALDMNREWADKRNDAVAQHILGLRYQNGWGVPADIKEAAKWMKRSAENNEASAMCDLGNLYGRNQKLLGTTWSDAAAWYEKGGNLGNVGALQNYADLLDRGLGVKKDSLKAAQLLEKALAINPKSGFSNNRLALIDEEFLVTSIRLGDADMVKDYREKMLALFLASADAGDRYGEYNLGLYYYSRLRRPEDVPAVKDDRLAYQYFEKAAEQGHVSSRFYLGEMHESGIGVPVTYTEAAYHYRIAALDGNKEALRRLVNLYLTGRLGEVDLARASYWLNQLYKSGEVGSLIPIADIMLKSGQYENATKLYEKLATAPQGVIAGYACERLSRIHGEGLGVAADPGKARGYFDKAVALHNPDALTRLAQQQLRDHDPTNAVMNLELAAHLSADARFELGHLYYVGGDVQKDEAKALQYMRSAASGNSLQALYFLAALTYDHDPNAPPLDEAIRYAQQAESGGLPQAAKMRELLEKRRMSATGP